MKSYLITPLIAILAIFNLHADEKKLKVTVSLPPQAMLVQRIAGNAAEVNIMVPDGKSPHDYSPSPQQVRGVIESDVYFLLSNMPFEDEIVKKLNGQSKAALINASAGIKYLQSTPCEHHHDGKNTGEENHHESENGNDPHIWMNPENLKIMATNILTELQRLRPAHSKEFQAAYQKLCAELNAADKKIAAQMAPFKGRIVYVYHPSFGYFCDRYGLKQMAIEEGGKDPTPKQIMELIADAKRDNVKVILVQKQFNSRSAAKIGEAINGRVVPIDNLVTDVIPMLENLSHQITLGLSGK